MRAATIAHSSYHELAKREAPLSFLPYLKNRRAGTPQLAEIAMVLVLQGDSRKGVIANAMNASNVLAH